MIEKQHPEFSELAKMLGNFLHITNKLSVLWGSKECRTYLHSLTISDRPNRAGFPFDAIVAISSLIELHDKSFPEYLPKPSVWDIP